MIIIFPWYLFCMVYLCSAHTLGAGALCPPKCELEDGCLNPFITWIFLRFWECKPWEVLNSGKRKKLHLFLAFGDDLWQLQQLLSGSNDHWAAMGYRAPGVVSVMLAGCKCLGFIRRGTTSNHRLQHLYPDAAWGHLGSQSGEDSRGEDSFLLPQPSWQPFVNVLSISLYQIPFGLKFVKYLYVTGHNNEVNTTIKLIILQLQSPILNNYVDFTFINYTLCEIKVLS